MINILFIQLAFGRADCLPKRWSWKNLWVESINESISKYFSSVSWGERKPRAVLKAGCADLGLFWPLLVWADLGQASFFPFICFLFVYLDLFFCFLRQGLSMKSWLSSNTLCRPSWPWTNRDPCASAYQVIGNDYRCTPPCPVKGFCFVF